MNILILTIGTRGDVQPYAALGKALNQRGHNVTFVTGKNFETLVTSYGIDFIPLEAGFDDVLNSQQGKKLVNANPLKILRTLKTFIFPLYQSSLSIFYNLSLNADKVIFHPKTLADCFADQFPEKMVRGLLVPAVQPTVEFPNPVLGGLPIPSFLNKSSYKLTKLTLKILSSRIREFRNSHGLSGKFVIPEIGEVYAISPYFLEKPIDYPMQSTFTGFWFENFDNDLTEDLKQFLAEGDPPLLITFGSMPLQLRSACRKH